MPADSPRLRPVATLALAAALLAAGCDREPAAGGEAAGEAAAGGAPRRGGQVVIAFSSDIAGVNQLIHGSNRPTESVLRHVYLQLVRENADFETGPSTFRPDLAESWEWSDDHKTVTFHLRRNAAWSDGRPVTAADVRFSWQAQIHPDIAWDIAYYKEAITDVEVVDPHTVRFHFSRVYPSQLLELTEGYILPEHVFGRIPFSEWRTNEQWFRDHAVYAGPFVIESWTPQQELVLARNPRYYDPERPRLDRVIIRIIPDPSSRLTQLLAGGVDFIDSLSPEEVARVERDPELQVVEFWGPTFVYVAWNLRREPFDDPAVRLALTLGIDRQTVVDNVWGEYGRVSHSPVLQNVWIYDRSLVPHPYDPERAKRLLAERGWTDRDGDGVLDKDGRRLALELLTNVDNRQRVDATVLIQSHLARIGVEVTPRALEFQSFVTRTDEGDFDAVIGAWTMPTGLDFRYAFHSAEIGDGSNFVGYSNPEVDRLLDEIRAQAELAAAEPLLLRLQQTLHRELPYTFLWESKRAVALNRRVRDADPNVLYVHDNLYDWWVGP
jgi:peptide/nickel transport system substrate-binding protein